jgi:CheY-like chemotaxis protein
MQGERLLICDDEPAFGRFVKNVAENLGYQVEVTTTWQAFMQAYLAFKPTTIVLDIVMPGMDGIELVGWLGSLQSSARLIIVTGYAPDYAANAKILAEYKGLGPVTTLHKPIEVNRLRAALQSQESL